MMKQANKEINDKVRATLDMFSEAERLKADNDFYKKTMFKMHALSARQKKPLARFKAGLQPLALGLIVAVNLYVGIAVFSGQSVQNTDSATSINAFAKDYMLANIDYDWLQLNAEETK